MGGLLEWFRQTRRNEPVVAAMAAAAGGGTAQKAKQRLEILIAHERNGGGVPEFLPHLQREVIEVIRKYVEVDKDRVQIDFASGDRFSTLEVNVELPARLPRTQLV